MNTSPESGIGIDLTLSINPALEACHERGAVPTRAEFAFVDLKLWPSQFPSSPSEGKSEKEFMAHNPLIQFGYELTSEELPRA